MSESCRADKAVDCKLMNDSTVSADSLENADLGDEKHVLFDAVDRSGVHYFDDLSHFHTKATEQAREQNDQSALRCVCTHPVR